MGRYRHVRNYTSGDMIGKLMFISADLRTSGKAKFKCYCGEEFVSRLANVEQLITRSCGCLRREMARTRTKVVISEETIIALEADFKKNNMTMRALAAKHGLSASKVNNLKNKYYERL
jgi:hypothetical protein